MTNKARIKEIFTSIQGEGPYVGVKQLFIRFCGCNLSCNFCDTNFDNEYSKEYTIEELLNIVKENSDCHSVSLTGGEPLMHSEFLKEFLPECPLPVYLETNSTMTKELARLIDYVDYVSADIKIPSCTGESPLWNEHDKFFDIAQNKNLFAKLVFDENITDEEIDKSAKLAAKHGIELVLQPKFEGEHIAVHKEFIESVFDRFISKYKKLRLIPQVHKFLSIR